MVLQRTGLPHSRDDVADSGVPQPLPRLTLVRSLQAQFEGTHEVSWKDDFGNKGSLVAKQVIVAVGGRPQVYLKPEQGAEHVITSDDLFAMPKSPGKVLIVGAGYIALECGGFLNAMGYETHIAVRSQPLRVGFDTDCVTMIVGLMKDTGTVFHELTDLNGVTKTPEGRLLCRMARGPRGEKEDFEEVYDTVLYATGRYADTHRLQLDKAGVKTNRSGFLEVDEKEATNVSHIYAIGDCATSPCELTPVAIQSGETLARRLFGGSEAIMDYRLIPTTVFTPFELGTIGLTEEEVGYVAATAHCFARRA